jgi:hypothetical protein
MRNTRAIDILLNICAPLLLGMLLYPFSMYYPIPPFIKYHLADGLWAYAFLSAFLIIWERKINFFWISILFPVAAGYEWLQAQHMIAGTGDVLDILSYFSFFFIALLFNSYYKSKLYHAF